MYKLFANVFFKYRFSFLWASVCAFLFYLVFILSYLHDRNISSVRSSFDPKIREIARELEIIEDRPTPPIETGREIPWLIPFGEPAASLADQILNVRPNGFGYSNNDVLMTKVVDQQKELISLMRDELNKKPDEHIDIIELVGTIAGIIAAAYAALAYVDAHKND